MNWYIINIVCSWILMMQFSKLSWKYYSKQRWKSIRSRILDFDLGFPVQKELFEKIEIPKELKPSYLAYKGFTLVVGHILIALSIYWHKYSISASSVVLHYVEYCILLKKYSTCRKCHTPFTIGLNKPKIVHVTTPVVKWCIWGKCCICQKCNSDLTLTEVFCSAFSYSKK